MVARAERGQASEPGRNSRSRSRSVSPLLPSGPASERRRPHSRDRGHHHGHRGRSRSRSRSRSPRHRDRESGGRDRDKGHHHGHRGRSRSPSRSRSPRHRDRGGGRYDSGSHRRGGRYQSRSPGGYSEQGRRGQDSRYPGDHSSPYRGRDRGDFSPPRRPMSRDRDNHMRDGTKGDGRRRGVDDGVRRRGEDMANAESPNQNRSGHTEQVEGEEEMDEEQKMMAMLGFGGFQSTKGKHVAGADMSGVSVKKTRTYRQYMNRRGGFNRALDAVP